MEDAHAFVYDFGGVRGQGFFGVFDGHAGKHAAEWCGQHFHEVRTPLYLVQAPNLSQFLLDHLISHTQSSVPDVFNATYHSVDDKLSEQAEKQGSSSGCTAVTVLLRLEDEDGKPIAHPKSGGVDRKSKMRISSGGGADDTSPTSPKSTSSSSSSLLSSFARKIRHESHGDEDDKADGKGSASQKSGKEVVTNIAKDGLVEVTGESVRRVLYTANVGDARAILW